MLSCNELLAQHSEYIDGLLPGPRVEQVRLHLQTCDSCARYDRVLRKGVSLLGVPSVEPSDDFLGSLHSRLALEEQRQTMRPVTIATSASVSIAAVLALVAWIPTVISSQPSHAVVTALTAPTELATLASSTREVRLASTSADVSLISYSPLILESPTAPPSYAVTLTSLESR